MEGSLSFQNFQYLIKELNYFDRSKKYPTTNTLQEEKLINRLKKKEWSIYAIKQLLISLRDRNFSKAKWQCKYFFATYNDDWYLSLFNSYKGIAGEFTPAYSVLDKEGEEKMHSLLPNVKLLFIIRNPIERIWSHYKFMNVLIYKRNLKNIPTAEIKEYLNHESVILHSDYIRTIENYLTYYPKNQLFIGFYDAIVEKPENLLHGIVDFLGGNTSQISKYCNISKKENVSPKSNISKEIEDYLKEKYYNRISQLSTLLGSYCSKWLDEAYYTESNIAFQNLPAFTFVK